MAQGEILPAAQRGGILPKGAARCWPADADQGGVTAGRLAVRRPQGSSIAFMIEILAGADRRPWSRTARTNIPVRRPRRRQTVILIDPLHVPGNRYLSGSSLSRQFASGVERRRPSADTRAGSDAAHGVVTIATSMPKSCR
jgi:LDH2 family malate/lactate/ureidoglycolate dehydrogenase